MLIYDCSKKEKNNFRYIEPKGKGGFKMDFETIKKMLKETILEEENINIIDDNDNLFNSKYNISSMNMVYIMTTLERKLNKSIMNIFEDKDYSVMTVNNIVQLILNNNF